MKTTHSAILKTVILLGFGFSPLIYGETDEGECQAKVLLIGDSISIGYTDMVRSLLKDSATVERIPGNGGSTHRGIEKVKQWTGGDDWDVIHFNFGIHDAKLPPEGVGHSELDVYEENLRKIVSQLRETGAELIWASSTPIPFGGYFRPSRRFADIKDYNRVALKVMAEEGVSINDLYSAIEPRAEEFYKGRDLHFTDAGYGFLAERVAVAIRSALNRRKEQALSKPQASSHPNILFIFTDDQGYEDLGAFGHPYVQTPNLDRLARGGTKFTQFYVNSPVCAPSRVAAMTGHFPARHNVHYIYSAPRVNREHGVPPYLDPEVGTVADILGDAGYITGHLGKWHLGGKVRKPDPSQYGFHMAKISDTVGAHPDYRKRFRNTEHDVTDLDHWMAEDAIAFIENSRNQGKPFFLNFWTLTPHAPLNPRPEDLAVYEDLKASPDDFSGWMHDYAANAKNLTEQMKVYCASVTSMDRAIGKVLDYLDKAGLADNTIVIFTSDNGPEDYHIGNSANAGVGSPGIARGRKRSIYDGGVKVPCIVRWPGKVENGVESDAVWSIVDLMPTLASIAGKKVPDDWNPDGENVSDIWTGSERPHQKPLFWEWKFSVAGNSAYHPPQLAVRDGEWKLLCSPEGDNVELYNIPADPSERRNVAKLHPEIVGALKAKVLDWKATLPEGYIYD